MNKEHSPLPWKVATNPGGPKDQPAFPCIKDASGEKDGMDIVAMPLGNSELVRANAELIVRCTNAHEALVGMVSAFLQDQETLKAPFRNDALCEEANELLKGLGR